MKVRCIKEGIDLTLGKVYEVLEIKKYGYLIVDDSGDKRPRWEGKFEVVEEPAEEDQGYYFFDHSGDLHMKGKMSLTETNYKQLKPISGETLLTAGANRAELELFVKKFGFFTPVEFNKEFIEYAEDEGWMLFLIYSGFVEKAPKATYKCGDRFRNTDPESTYNGNEYILASIAEKAAFVNLADGHYWRAIDKDKIKNLSEITEEELSLLGNPDCFTKIN